MTQRIEKILSENVNLQSKEGELRREKVELLGEIVKLQSKIEELQRK
jgi:hypothetical protein